MSDPISAALRKASTPIDMWLPTHWSWCKSGPLRGFYLCYLKRFVFFLGDEIFATEPEWLIKERVRELLLNWNSGPKISKRVFIDGL